MALFALGACSNAPDPVGNDVGVTERVSSPGPIPPSMARVPPSAARKVFLEPANRSTNVSSNSILVWAEDDRGAEPIDLAGLPSTIELRTWPGDEPVEILVRALEDDARRGRNVLEVVPHELAEGWFQLRAGPLDAGKQWATGNGLSYVLSNDGIASSRFRIGSEPSVRDVQVCAIAAGERHKVYIGISEAVHVMRPVAEHVAIRTARGPTRCESIQDQDMNGTLDYDSLNFVCDGIREDDTLTVQLTDAFAPIAAPDRAAAASTEEVTFELTELLHFADSCGVFVPDDHSTE